MSAVRTAANGTPAIQRPRPPTASGPPQSRSPRAPRYGWRAPTGESPLRRARRRGGRQNAVPNRRSLRRTSTARGGNHGQQELYEKPCRSCRSRRRTTLPGPAHRERSAPGAPRSPVPCAPARVARTRARSAGTSGSHDGGGGSLNSRACFTQPAMSSALETNVPIAADSGTMRMSSRMSDMAVTASQRRPPR